MKTNRDIRVIRTQTALLEALEELIKTKKLSNITITELCTEAKINRNTFYYHYNNIFEFLDEHKKLIIDDLNDITDLSKSHNKKNLIEMFNIMKQHTVKGCDLLNQIPIQGAGRSSVQDR